MTTTALVTVLLGVVLAITIAFAAAGTAALACATKPLVRYETLPSAPAPLALGAEIPRQIHMMWLDKRKDNRRVPPDHQPLFRRMAAANPGWTLRFWNRRAVERLLASPELAEVRRGYEAAVSWISKCDIARFAVLWVHGGVYMDMDVYACRPFDDLVRGRHMLLALECPSHSLPADGVNRRLSNGELGFAPRHPLVWGWLHVMSRRLQRGLPFMWSTFVTTFATFLAQYGEELLAAHGLELQLVPTAELLPIPTSGRIRRGRKTVVNTWPKHFERLDAEFICSTT